MGKISLNEALTLQNAHLIFSDATDDEQFTTGVKYLQDSDHGRRYLFYTIQWQRDNLAGALETFTPLVIELFKVTGHGSFYLQVLSQEPIQVIHRELRRRYMSDWADAGYLDRLKDVVQNEDYHIVDSGFRDEARDAIEPVLTALAVMYRIWVELGIDMDCLRMDDNVEYLWSRFGSQTGGHKPEGKSWWTMNGDVAADFASNELYIVMEWTEYVQVLLHRSGVNSPT